SSVEPGSVLAELCANDNSLLSPNVSMYVEQLTGFTPGANSSLSESSLANSLCQLKRSYRFSESSGIARLARLVNAGETLFFDSYTPGEYTQEDVVFFPLEQQEHCLALVLERYAGFIKACQQTEASAAHLLQLRSAFQVLCATREGRWGVNEINTWVENALRKSGLIPNNGYYPGCAIMINQNSYAQQLFNGDIGLVLADSDHRNELSVFFPPQISGGDQAPRRFHLSRLPPHEKVYAMTVHKSQGSEFDEIVLVYPDQDSPVLTRELLYTAVTRAKKRCYLLADQSLLNASVKRKTRRDSGLAAMLAKQP
ncbi:MAG TPA: ATP-binding domain-containing protein, partial [Pseudomonadales bacterium]|nr:ATP-binding domain-containing protein [Pseudomonadales bacterium]